MPLHAFEQPGAHLRVIRKRVIHEVLRAKFQLSRKPRFGMAAASGVRARQNADPRKPAQGRLHSLFHAVPAGGIPVEPEKATLITTDVADGARSGKLSRCAHACGQAGASRQLPSRSPLNTRRPPGCATLLSDIRARLP